MARTSSHAADFNGGALITATASAPLGGLSASAAAVPTVVATATAALGGLTATAAAKPTVVATASAALGGLTATATATVTVPVSATSALGALTATASATPTVAGTASASLGGLTATAAATVTSAAATTPPGGDPRDSSPWAHELVKSGQGALRFVLTLTGTGEPSSALSVVLDIRSSGSVEAASNLDPPELSTRSGEIRGTGRLVNDYRASGLGAVPDTIEELEELELLLGGPLYA